MTSKELREKRAALLDESRAILEKDGPTPEEMERAKTIIDVEVKSLDAQIELSDQLEASEARNRQPIATTVPQNDATGAPQITDVRNRIEDDGQRGYNHFGDFCRDVHACRSGSGVLMPDQLRAATNVGQVGVGEDAGFMVPPTFASEIMGHAFTDSALLPLTNNIPISGNTLTFPSDNTTPWGSTGIIARWAAEKGSMTDSKPATNLIEVRLHKLYVLAAVTDELLQDAMALPTYLAKKSGEAIQWKADESIVKGTGAGQPQGFSISPAIVEQAKVTSQTADTIVAGNVASMWSRLVSSGQVSAKTAWLINPAAMSQLPLMTIGDQPVWLPPSKDIFAAPGGTLFGRPVIPHQACEVLGDAGDIYLVDFNQYITISKGPQTAQSIHLWFDTDEVAFRVTFRLGGQGWPNAAITGADATTTYSPFVRVAARA